MPVFGKNASRHPSSELSLESGASSGKRCRLIFFFFFFHYEPRRRWYWMSATRAPFGIYNNSLSFYRAALKKPICPKGCLSLSRARGSFRHSIDPRPSQSSALFPSADYIASRIARCFTTSAHHLPYFFRVTTTITTGELSTDDVINSALIRQRADPYADAAST